MKKITSVIMPKINIWTKEGQVVSLLGNEKYISGGVFTQQKPSGKTYNVTVAIQLNSTTGIPYAAHLYSHKGGNATGTTPLAEINLAKLTFIETNGKKVQVSNSGKLKDLCHCKHQQHSCVHRVVPIGRL